ncbi:integrase, partial [Helicobacter sp. 13S00482-2]|uniref:tyrosine-type recombinase/integrase n=1 Tax=Helicobacter sp. 13S00482-2 TaxID=1476200 RepID=UPI000BCA3ED4
DIVIKFEKTSSPDSARRAFWLIRDFWRYAFNIGLLKANPLSDIVISDILSPVSNNHYPKITDEKILGELLRCIDAYPHSLMIRTALAFVALVPLRSGNLSKLKWSYIDWDNKTLGIPRSEMKDHNKNFSDFKLPLSTQAINILNEVKIFTGWGEWVFHSAANPKKPMVGDSLSKALRMMGFNDEARGRKQLVHSFRGTFRSLVDTYQNEHNASFEIKEAILDHRIGNKVTQAYVHKADYTEQARPLLQWWADFLDRVKKS